MNEKARKTRRAGASVTVGVSLDVETKRKLKALEFVAARQGARGGGREKRG